MAVSASTDKSKLTGVAAPVANPLRPSIAERDGHLLSHPTKPVKKSSIDPVLDPHHPSIKPVLLKPRGNLDLVSGSTFHTLLRYALQSSDTVIVDLLWVDEIGATGLDALKAGIKMAIDQGKNLTFQGADFRTYQILEAEWQYQWTQIFDQWQHRCKRDLADFLRERKLAREASLLKAPVPVMIPLNLKQKVHELA